MINIPKYALSYKEFNINIRKILASIESANYRLEKICETNHLYQYICDNYHIFFDSRYKKFQMVVEKRLHDLIKEAHYSAAIIYLKRLFPYSSYTK